MSYPDSTTQAMFSVSVSVWILRKSDGQILSQIAHLAVYIVADLMSEWMQKTKGL